MFAYYRDGSLRPAPPEKASDAEVSAFVAGNATAIGYVDAATPLPNGVKVLNIAM